MQPNTPMILTPKAQEGIIQYSRQCYLLQATNWNIREVLRNIDLAYIRENDNTKENSRARISNTYGDPTKFQNVVVPVVMPIVESAVVYQSAVFLQGNPIFGVVSDPNNMDAAMQMETVIEDQQVRGGWVNEFIKVFRDGFKYNLAGVEVDWSREVTATLETDILFSTKEAKPKELIWEGNSIKHLDLYNTFFDIRVPPNEVHKKGEFAGYNKLMSRIELKDFINKLPIKMVENVIAAFQSGFGSAAAASTGATESYYLPQLNPGALFPSDTKRSSMNWMSWAGLTGANNKIQYRDSYQVTILYARILPSDFNMRVPSPNTPQIWKFIIVNCSVIIYAERQTNAHGYLPILFMQPLDDGLGFQTKSLATNVMAVQSLTSALWNSNIAARRRAISDRTLYDPSRVAAEHINNENPSAKIPVRPTAYGKPVGEAVYAFPFRDEQSGLIMQETGQIMQMGNMIAGQNQARQGQFVKGNKTLHEFDTVMQNANGRDQLVAMVIEAVLMTPIKTMLKTNILQFQGGISLYSAEREQVVTIDPLVLRKTIMNFKVSDGLVPSDKLINSQVIQAAMQLIAQSPELNSQYNIGPMFSYFIKTQGGRISSFEKSQEQIAYETAVRQWQMTMQAMTQNFSKLEPEMIEKLMQQLPPQPTPEQFGYVPGKMGAAPGTTPPQPKVSNITNNITNSVAE